MGDLPKIMVCNCERTMALDGEKIAEALGIDNLKVHTNLCRREVSLFENEADGGAPMLVACTQEAPLFEEVRDERAPTTPMEFVNVRERAGWTDDPNGANAKIAALIAEATLKSEPPRLRTIRSDGLCLVYGSGQEAVDAAKLLNARLSVTLVLENADDVLLPNVIDFAIHQGKVTRVSGALGGFSIEVDGFAPLVPSSRASADFIMPKDGAKSQCSLILDLSGGNPLVTGHGKRDGYVHVDARDPAAVMRAIFDLSDMVGEFEKPIYVDYNADICAHSRNTKIGCSKCLDVCPAGAIESDGDIVKYDALICGGCGSCHSVCPTGAVSYQYPKRADILDRLFTLGLTFNNSDGKSPVLLVHDESNGTPLIDALARFGGGLPGNVIPFGVHSPTVFGHAEMLSAVVAGFGGVVFLCDPAKRDELSGLEVERDLALSILNGFGNNAPLKITSDPDPDALAMVLSELETTERAPASFTPSGDKRSIARLAITHLADEVGVSEPISLPQDAPYGRVAIDSEACTLCMACVSACPADAMMDTPDTPQLRFVEQACVQCSLCVKTCPENALTLEPRLNWTASAMQPITLNEEEPFECISCGTPFATKSTIERISEKLVDKHSMFEGSERADLIKMCGDCRVNAQASGGRDPFALGERPKVRTTDDYLESEKQGLSVEDFLIKR